MGENEVFDDEGNDVAMGESYDPYEHHKGTNRQDISHVVWESPFQM